MDYAVYAALLLGVFAAAFLVARSPAFWVGVAKVVFTAALPFILKRMPPTQEKEWRDLMLRGATQEEINTWERNRHKR